MQRWYAHTLHKPPAIHLGDIVQTTPVCEQLGVTYLTGTVAGLWDAGEDTLSPGFGQLNSLVHVEMATRAYHWTRLGSLEVVTPSGVVHAQISDRLRVTDLAHRRYKSEGYVARVGRVQGEPWYVLEDAATQSKIDALLSQADAQVPAFAELKAAFGSLRSFVGTRRVRSKDELWSTRKEYELSLHDFGHLVATSNLQFMDELQRLQRRLYFSVPVSACTNAEKA
jgi:hypothetical protein